MSGKEELKHHTLTIKLVLPSGDILITNCYIKVRSIHLVIGGNGLSVSSPHPARKKRTYTRLQYRLYGAQHKTNLAPREKADDVCKNISMSNDLNGNVQHFIDTVLQVAMLRILRNKRRHHRQYWSHTLEQVHEKQDSVREAIEQNTTPETEQHEGNLQLTKGLNVKTSNVNMKKESSKPWNLTRTQNEDTGIRHSRIIVFAKVRDEQLISTTLVRKRSIFWRNFMQGGKHNSNIRVQE